MVVPGRAVQRKRTWSDCSKSLFLWWARTDLNRGPKDYEFGKNRLKIKYLGRCFCGKPCRFNGLSAIAIRRQPGIIAPDMHQTAANGPEAERSDSAIGGGDGQQGFQPAGKRVQSRGFL